MCRSATRRSALFSTSLGSKLLLPRPDRSDHFDQKTVLTAVIQLDVCWMTSVRRLDALSYLDLLVCRLLQGKKMIRPPFEYQNTPSLPTDPSANHAGAEGGVVGVSGMIQRTKVGQAPCPPEECVSKSLGLMLWATTPPPMRRQFWPPGARSSLSIFTRLV